MGCSRILSFIAPNFLISFAMFCLSKSFCSAVLSSIACTVHNHSSCTPKILRPQIIVPQLQITIYKQTLWVPPCEKDASFINLDQQPLVYTASCWTWWLSIAKIISDLSSYLLCLGWKMSWVDIFCTSCLFCMSLLSQISDLQQYSLSLWFC